MANGGKSTFRRTCRSCGCYAMCWVFVQSERTLDRAQGGLGIGLSIVKGLVEMHGGTVEAASPGAGRGAIFTIRLPRITPPEALQQQSRAGSAVKRRVLIVDDNVDAADSLALLLKSDGHEAATAYSADTALEAVEHLRPEIVLLDVGLPQRDGYDIARHLRASNAVPGMRLIALTGYGRKRIASGRGRRGSTIICSSRQIWRHFGSC